MCTDLDLSIRVRPLVHTGHSCTHGGLLCRHGTNTPTLAYTSVCLYRHVTMDEKRAAHSNRQAQGGPAWWAATAWTCSGFPDKRPVFTEGEAVCCLFAPKVTVLWRVSTRSFCQPLAERRPQDPSVLSGPPNTISMCCKRLLLAVFYPPMQKKCVFLCSTFYPTPEISPLCFYPPP